jgi:trehalose/maltose hydrolase-like predicted phosphorylase
MELLSFEPMLPKNWKSLSFKILYRGRTLQVGIEKDQVGIKNLEGEGLDLYLMGTKKHLEASGSLAADR